MKEEKVKRLLTVNFRSDRRNQVILAKYLKTVGSAKDRVIIATSAYEYPLALAQQPMSTQQELELALLQSVQSLCGQAVNLVNFFRLNKGIELTPEQLAMAGLMSPYLSTTQMPNTIKTPLNGNIDDFDDDDLQLPENKSFDIEL
jgi:hypothetical protein